MSAHTDPTHPAIRIPVLIIGVAVAALGISGLLDDSGALPHSPWTIAIMAAIVTSASAIAHTVRKLMAAPDR